jgi:CheY-like chemotaxis protein
VNGYLVVDAALRQRLWRDCAMHETLVHEVTHATGQGQLEPDVALRSIALELHSVKGVASVLGCQPILAAIGTLGEALLHKSSVTKPSFWSDFAEWFSSLMGCLRASVDGQLDQAVLDSMSARLTDRGYPVRSARSLTETAQILAEFDPEIVVTDVRMPEVEGDELCKRIKSQMMRVVPVILYSGLPEEELAERARIANADAYVCKIRGIEGLIERMDELLSDEILF